MIYKFKIDDWSYSIFNILGDHIHFDVEHDKGTGFRTVIKFDIESKKLDKESLSEEGRFNFPPEFRVNVEKYLRLKAFS